MQQLGGVQLSYGSSMACKWLTGRRCDARHALACRRPELPRLATGLHQVDEEHRPSRPICCSSTQQETSAATTGPSSNPWAAPGYMGAAVSQLQPATQAAVLAAIAAGLGAGTVLTCATIAPFLYAHAPSFLQVTSKTWFPLGPIFVAAGIAHFTEEKGFTSMYPHQGAWGIWYLPGSPRFHVYWTGVAEILGGLGLMLGALPFDFIPSWLSPASAYGLFLLTIAVTPANVYMYTHNAPGPLPEGAGSTVLPWQGHAARGVMQVVLLAVLWGIATAGQ